MRQLSYLFFVCCLVFGFGLSIQSVQAVECSSQLARWNQDPLDPSGASAISPLFSCQWVSASQEINYDSPTTILPTSLGRDACVCDGERPAGQICACARQPDCSSIGGICLRNGQVFADMVLTDGTSRPDGYTVNVPFRCPGNSSVSCFIKANSSLANAQDPLINPAAEGSTSNAPGSEGSNSSGSDGPIGASTDDAPQEEPQQIIPFSNCCREIVPKDGQSYEQGAYGLNHFVQIGINVYECILCMVAALMLLMFVIGSFYLLTSAGQAPKVAKGIGIIKAAVIGGVIVFASILIVNFSVKALGGSFLDSPMIKINPGGGPQTAPTYIPPTVPATTLGTPPTSSGSTTSTATTTSSGSGTRGPASTANIQFSGCNPQQEQKYRQLVGMSQSINVSLLGNVKNYLESSFASVFCNGSDGGTVASYVYQVDAADQVANCPAEMITYDLLYTKNNPIAISTLIHESVHHYDCVKGKGKPDADSCIKEASARAVQADYLESIGEFTEAKNKRCNWGDLYTDNFGNPCVVTDPKC